MAFKARHENDRFDHSQCPKCKVMFAGVFSFDEHRKYGTCRLMNMEVINDLYVHTSKSEAYFAMLAKAETARAGRK